jgi:hypothetical protein
MTVKYVLHATICTEGACFIGVPEYININSEVQRGRNRMETRRLDDNIKMDLKK